MKPWIEAFRGTPAALVALGLVLFTSALLAPPAGCAHLGPAPNVDSTLDAVLETKATASAYALLVGDLLDAGVITPEQAAEQAQHLRVVQLELARVVDLVEATGDVTAAGTRLERVGRAMDLVVGFLAQHIDPGGAEFLDGRDRQPPVHLDGYDGPIGEAHGNR